MNDKSKAQRRVIPFAPSRDELVDLYYYYPKYVVRQVFRDVRVEHPFIIGGKTIKSLTPFQFLEVMKILGIPIGYEKKDFTFIDDSNIF